MNDLIDFLITDSSMACLVAVIIFIMSAMMLIKRLIGVMIICLLLVCTLLSGLAIVNHEFFKEILIGFKYDPEKTNDNLYAHYKKHLTNSFNELKIGYNTQKSHFDTLYNVYGKDIPEVKNSN